MARPADLLTPRRGSLRGVLARLVAALAVVLGILVAIAIAGMLLSASQYRESAVTAVERQSAANQLLVDLLNAETGNRGYTITGRGDYRQPYVDARERYPDDLARLRGLVEGEPSLERAVAAVDRTAQLWFDEAVQQIRLRLQERTDEAIARVNQGIAKARIDAFRSEHTALLGEVSRLRGESLESADRRRQLTLIAIAAAAVLALGVVTAAAVQLWRRMGGPVARLAEGVGRVSRGRYDEPVPGSDGAVFELSELTKGFNTMQSQLKDQRDQAAAAAAREAAQQTERRLWETVQAGLLPHRLPAAAGVRLAARYQPAEPGLLIGGDFYDAKPLRDGRLALVVGDVAGHGAHAAALAAGLRFGWRTLVDVDPDPALVLPEMSRQLSGHEERSQGIFASLLYALLSPSGELEIVSAGHPPPLLLTAQGCEPLQAERNGPLLGVFDSADWPVTRARLPQGSTLVLYTDGLIEARREIDLFGMERACVVLANERSSALETRVERLIDAARRHDAGNLRDDVVVLAVERLAEVPGPVENGHNVGEPNGAAAAVREPLPPLTA